MGQDQGIAKWVAYAKIQSSCQEGLCSHQETQRKKISEFSIDWYNSFPYGCTAHGCLLLQKQQREQGSRASSLAGRKSHVT